RREIECEACHGEVQSMDVVHQVYKFSMGFCIACHQEKAKDAQELTMLKDCLTCHY
ncbi:MAG: cytochrome C, partial [Deltaproteobacteria bacterium]|nr:cytochrome C [Deltaproteobacteria bacterium]